MKSAKNFCIAIANAIAKRPVQTEPKSCSARVLMGNILPIACYHSRFSRHDVLLDLSDPDLDFFSLPCYLILVHTF